MQRRVQVIGDTSPLGYQAPGLVDRAPDRARGQQGFRWVRYKAIGKFVAALDYALIVAASVVAGVGYHLLILGDNAPDLIQYVATGNIAAAIFVLAAASQSQYIPRNLIASWLQIRVVMLLWPLTLLSLTLFLFLMKVGSDFSRGSLIIFGFLGLLLLLASHACVSILLGNALAQATLPGDRAITIGDHETLMGLTPVDILQRSGAHEIKRFILPPATGTDYKSDLRVVDETVRSARTSHVDCILLALPWSDDHRRGMVCERLRRLPLPVLLLPDRHVESILSRTPRLGSDFTIEIQRAPLSPGEQVAKRAMDLILAVSLIVALAPLLAAVSVLIKLDSPGPVIFRQRRKGFNGQEFTIFKFRTMKVLEDGRVIPQARRNDIRVTRVGRILRAFSVDELPQLINVLRSEMSLVGPRPHALAHDDSYSKLIANYARRQHVKPGLTGWAQVNGFRGETKKLELMEKRVALDLWYVRHWGLWLDLRIIGRSCFEIFRRQNAY